MGRYAGCILPAAAWPEPAKSLTPGDSAVSLVAHDDAQAVYDQQMKLYVPPPMMASQPELARAGASAVRAHPHTHGGAPPARARLDLYDRFRTCARRPRRSTVWQSIRAKHAKHPDKESWCYGVPRGVLFGMVFGRRQELEAEQGRPQQAQTPGFCLLHLLLQEAARTQVDTP